MIEYRSVAYRWKGRGWTQEIQWLQIEGEDADEWKGRKWTDFLVHMEESGWAFKSAIPLGGGGTTLTYGLVAFFRRAT